MNKPAITNASTSPRLAVKSGLRAGDTNIVIVPTHTIITPTDTASGAGKHR